MSEMVERVAQAIIASAAMDFDVIRLGRARNYARAAIEAMREPTEAMTLATDLTTEFDGYAAWQAMIDEALSNKP